MNLRSPRRSMQKTSLPSGLISMDASKPRPSTPRPRLFSRFAPGMIRVHESTIIRSPMFVVNGSGDRRFVDVLNGRSQCGVELGVGLLGVKPFQQRAREARDHSMIEAQFGVGFRLRIAARKREHPYDFGMAREV